MKKTICAAIFAVSVMSYNSYADEKKYNFTSDWFSLNIPIWSKQKLMLDGLPGKRCLEVGSYEGRSTIWLAENYCNGKGSTIDAVDTWEGSIEHSAKQKEGIYERFKSNLAPFIKEKRVIINKGPSIDILMRFIQEVRAGKREKYDFVYIDASHIAKDVLIDAVLSWELLKIGGLMYFDDYPWGVTGPNSPKVSIDGFLAAYSTMYEVLEQGYQVHLKKIAEVPKP
jgi:predicted O-methyltransferase YrrM